MLKYFAMLITVAAVVGALIALWLWFSRRIFAIERARWGDKVHADQEKGVFAVIKGLLAKKKTHPGSPAPAPRSGVAGTS